METQAKENPNEFAVGIPEWLLDVDHEEVTELRAAGITSAVPWRDLSEIPQGTKVIPTQDQAELERTAAILLRRAAAIDASRAALTKRRDTELDIVQRAYAKRIEAAERNYQEVIDHLKKIAWAIDYPGKLQSKQFGFGTLGYERKAGGVLEVKDKAAAATWLADADPELEAARVVRVTVQMDLGTAREIDHLIEQRNAAITMPPGVNEVQILPTLEASGDLDLLVKPLRKWYETAKSKLQGEIPAGCDVSETQLIYYAKPIEGERYQKMDDHFAAAARSL